MANDIGFATTRFKLKAVVTTDDGDLEFPDIVAISATFALNAIPTATLLVPTGVNVETGEKAAIHRHKNKLRPRDKIKVTLTVDTPAWANEKMPSGEYVIFEGFYIGTAFERSYNSANYELQLTHWLDDLNNSSLMNGNWFPNAPFSMAHNAASFILGPGGGNLTGVGDRRWAAVPAIDAGEIITPANIQEDLWDKVLKPAFTAIAKFPAPGYQEENTQTNRENARTNDAALAALERMPGKGREYYKELGLDVAGLLPETIQNAVSVGMSKEALEGFAYSTFWSKLVGDYGSQFFFAISPSVEFALPVPFFAGLQGYHTTIRAEDYAHAKFNSRMTQVIESVDIFYPAQISATNYMNGQYSGGGEASPPGMAFPLGWYPPITGQRQNKKGMKLLKECPQWMYNFIPEAPPAARAAGITDKEIGDTTSPQKGPSAPPPNVPTPEAAQRELVDSNALSRFAEHYFKTEVLSQRFGELSGKLRFDIAPGSVVQIETPPDDPTKRNREVTPEDSVYATVIQVSFVINAEKAAAGTSFVLSHLRSYGENTELQYTRCENCGGADRPPLYSKPWFGGPLAIKKE